ncbi:MAG: radical SAM protein, partial [Candidatus Margulisiibacteriota bacterium]
MSKICNYYVTLRCNDTCEFCHCWQNEKFKEIEEKPYDLLQLKRSGVDQLNITGGEPLLREDLPDLLTKAKELGFYVQLSTNGILYGDKARLLGGLVDRLFVSL